MRPSTAVQRAGKTVYSEQRSNEILRSVDLPCEVDPAHGAIKATCDQGVLTITLPKSAKAVGREIKVESKAASA